MENNKQDRENIMKMTESQKEEAIQLAGHLASNYLNAVWDVTPGQLHPTDVTNIQERYDQVKMQVVTSYEKSLNQKVLKFLMLKRKKKGETISIDDVTSIIKYKLVTKPKRKLACYMWDKEYDIYPSVRR